MSKAKHTEITIGQNELGEVAVFAQVDDGKPEGIWYGVEPEHEATMKDMVMAYNSHDDLLAALKGMIDATVHFNNNYPSGEDGQCDELLLAREVADTEIAKAEGGEQ